MCGVFGFIAQTPEDRVDLGALSRIASATERRGPHAFGFAWVDGRGRLRSFKQQGRITEHLAALKLARDAVAVIGHCRYATHGDASNNLNNHPFACDGGWLVHNGVIGHYRSLIDVHGLPPTTECDSESLALLVERFDGSRHQRVADAAVEASKAPLVSLALWSRRTELVMVRNGNPLHVAYANEGIYLASLPTDMPATPRRVANGQAISLRFKSGELEWSAMKLDEDETVAPAKKRSVTGDAAGDAKAKARDKPAKPSKPVTGSTPRPGGGSVGDRPNLYTGPRHEPKPLGKAKKRDPEAVHDRWYRERARELIREGLDQREVVRRLEREAIAKA